MEKLFFSKHHQNLTQDIFQLQIIVRKLTKAYKVNRIAINCWQISLGLVYPYLKGRD